MKIAYVISTELHADNMYIEGVEAERPSSAGLMDASNSRVRTSDLINP